jgi:hypothetical protein
LVRGAGRETWSLESEERQSLRRVWWPGSYMPCALQGNEERGVAPLGLQNQASEVLAMSFPKD